MPPLSDHNLELCYWRVHRVAVVLPFALVPGDALIDREIVLAGTTVAHAPPDVHKTVALNDYVGAPGGVLASDNLPGLDGGCSDDVLFDIFDLDSM